MPIWKDPIKDPPKEGETYLLSTRCAVEPVIAKFYKSTYPYIEAFSFLGNFITDDGTAYQIWKDRRNEVLKYKLLVPHM